VNQMTALIWADWVIISIVAVSTLISLKRGFVKEALSLVIWVAAFVIARTFHPHLQTLLADTIETGSVRLIAAFGILFVGTLVVGAIVNNLIGALVRMTGLSATDRVLGMCFGLARGLIVVVAAVALLRYTPVTEDTWWRASPLIRQAVLIEQWTRRTLGDDLQRLAPPPSQSGAEVAG
jgi:membrane protein required for colicin V production